MGVLAHRCGKMEGQIGNEIQKWVISQIRFYILTDISVDNWYPQSGEFIIESQIVYPSRGNQPFQEKSTLSDFSYVVGIKNKQLCKNTEILQDLFVYNTVIIFFSFWVYH